MKKHFLLFPLLAMLCLILDSATASAAARDGVELVLWSALPALFPFFVLSAMIVPWCGEISIPVLSRLLGIPRGWESVFLLGCIGGYPVGAQCVVQGYTSGQLEKEDAQRMLGLCCNCGPSFLFGIVAAAFPSPAYALGILLIGLCSSLLTAAFWPGTHCQNGSRPILQRGSLPQAVQTGLRSMASVSAWIILGKVLLAFAEKYLLGRFPPAAGLFLSGLLELTNGCLKLTAFPDSLRFPAACLFTSFGGLCVWMQVRSLCAAGRLDPKCYLPQKLIQGAIALFLAWVCVHTPGGWIHKLAVVSLCTGIGLVFKKTVEIPGSFVYNGNN